jgi:polyhydroxybutyrate depolymerase
VREILMLTLLSAIAQPLAAQSPGGFQPNPKPTLSGTEKRLTVSTGGRERTALLYVPQRLAERPAMVFVLHGVTGNGDRIRMFTGYDFDRTADEEGFVVVYPDGVSGRWNDCRVSTKRAEEERDVDDAAFLRLLAQQVERELQMARAPHFVVGYSNGGHMALRLAVEHPGDVNGVAVFGTNLPATDNWDCKEAKRPLPVLMISGTKDPVNPFEGGLVRPPVGPPLGTVRSARASAEYFAALTGASGIKTERLPDRADDGTWLEQLTWARPGEPEVSLLIVHGGGHSLPNRSASFPPIVGPTSKDASGAGLIWAFFERQISRHTLLLSGKADVR